MPHEIKGQDKVFFILYYYNVNDITAILQETHQGMKPRRFTHWRFLHHDLGAPYVADTGEA